MSAAAAVGPLLDPAGAQDPVDHSLGVRADLRCPPAEAIPVPGDEVAVRLGHMALVRHKGALGPYDLGCEAARSPSQDTHTRTRVVGHLDPPANKVEGHRVVATVE